MKTAIKTKEQALANWLAADTGEAVKAEDIQTTSYDYEFEYGDNYFVMTDDEADEKCAEAIKDSLWAFNASFIVAHCGKDVADSLGVTAGLEAAIRSIQEKLCESANPVIAKLINDLDYFIEDAIQCDGRGHFLSGYDGEENEQDGYFIYRQ